MLEADILFQVDTVLVAAPSRLCSCCQLRAQESLVWEPRLQIQKMRLDKAARSFLPCQLLSAPVNLIIAILLSHIILPYLQSLVCEIIVSRKPAGRRDLVIICMYKEGTQVFSILFTVALTSQGHKHYFQMGDRPGVPHGFKEDDWAAKSQRPKRGLSWLGWQLNHLGIGSSSFSGLELPALPPARQKRR